ncbi:MAG TPA: N-acetyltransferase [Bacteroidetes bacterium]|nr:N-acetyltransferase [Bacteroidota bacterium]HEX03951.1 N-acetyltransferase [Bacteroidota bacterium]
MERKAEKPPYFISDDKSLLEVDVIHGYLTRSYWAKGIRRGRIETVIETSLCWGLYEQHEDRSFQQIGFARVLTDLSAIAYLMDVFVLEEHQGKGLGKWLVEEVLSCSTLKPVRRWILATADAQSLYARYGFTPLPDPEHYMQKYDPEKYNRD